MAGVSLVADAAEQLERGTNGGDCSTVQQTFAMPSNGMYNTAGMFLNSTLFEPNFSKNIHPIGSNPGHLSSPSFTGMCLHQSGDAVTQPQAKLKLQLFPMDEITRQGLEKVFIICSLMRLSYLLVDWMIHYD